MNETWEIRNYFVWSPMLILCHLTLIIPFLLPTPETLWMPGMEGRRHYRK